MDDETLSLGVDIDATAALSVLDDLERRSQSFGRALTSALSSAASGGKGLDDVLRGLGNRLTAIALQAGLKPLENLVSGLAGSLVGSVTPYAQGGVPGRVTPFADGGVVSAPTYFSMGHGTGLMGEAGAEAILPLKRGPDGALGVESNGGGGQQIVFNVTATDAESFRRSEGQITAMLARSLARGKRGL